MNRARYIAVKLLEKTFGSSSYSNIQLNSGLENSDLGQQDKKLCSAIYYGVIERKITLDYIISAASSRPIEKIDSIILNILRSGIYQILYMDSIPDNAAVNESVELAKKFAKTSASGMVNAILRNFIRSGKKINLPKEEYKRFSVMYSAPEWLVKSLEKDYGMELAENLLSDALGQPPVTVRSNPLACSDEEFMNEFSDGEIIRSEVLPHCFKLIGKDPAHLDIFGKGWFHVQDMASQLCCAALSPTEEDTVLDICAAPGGKTFTMAEMMNNKGKIYAFDLHEKRVQLIRMGAERLGIENITANAGDASKYDPALPLFTKILCDVPCSGIGAVRRKPEIKYKDPADFARLPQIQYDILKNALNYLAVGGELVYSTCTLRKEENDEVVDRILSENKNIEPVGLPEPLGAFFDSRASIFPKYFGSDGFFIAKFKKLG